MIYFGITIGPIIETLELTSSPAGLWCASYMFSDITYQICCALRKEFANDKLKIYSPYFPAEKDGSFCEHPTECSLSVPEVEDPSQKSEGRMGRVIPQGVGSYHDRIIFSCGEESSNEEKQKQEYKEFSERIDTIIKDVKTEVARKIPVNFQQDLEKYFSIQFLSVREENVGSDTNIILTISEYLDALELDRPVSGEGKIQLKNFFDNERSDTENERTEAEQNKSNNSKKDKSSVSTNIEEQGKNKLIKDSAYVRDIIDKFKGDPEEDINKTLKSMFPLLKKSGDNFFIRNITEISTHGEYTEMDKRDEKNEKPKWYFALIQADGDNMGKLLQKVSNDKIEDFSEKCMAFSVEASQKIHEFGGVTIYAGGDDLLFIAPIFNNPMIGPGEKRENILDLCGELENLFRAKFETPFINTITEDRSENVELSLSFGVALCYNKEPLYEVLKNTQGLLFGKAKSIRNVKSIELRKHSGGEIGFNLVNGSKVEKGLLKLIGARDSEDKVNSILYHLHEFEHLYDLAFMENSDDKNKIECFFKNMFDRYVGQEDQKEKSVVFKNEYVKAIYELAIVHWNENRSKYTSQKKEKDYSPARELAALLRFAKFFGEEGSVHE